MKGFGNEHEYKNKEWSNREQEHMKKLNDLEMKYNKAKGKIEGLEK